jgi:hypothetical protein
LISEAIAYEYFTCPDVTYTVSIMLFGIRPTDLEEFGEKFGMISL